MVFDSRRFEVPRRMLREALHEDGVGVDIDAAVRDLLTDTGRDDKTPESRA